MPTIGVALALPEPWAEQLQTYRADLGDETATLIPPHITLVSPLEVAPDALPAVEEHLATAARSVHAFRVHLRGTGTFRPVSPVVFVVVVAGISQCEQLAGAVRRGPLETPLTFPYHPHVTVAHHLPDDVLDRAFTELAGFECEFAASSFSLYEHDEARGWQPTREFPLPSHTRVG